MNKSKRKVFQCIDACSQCRRFLYRPLNEFVSLWWTFGGGTKLIVDSNGCVTSHPERPPPPVKSCRGTEPLWCVWPAGASPHPGGWTGRWGAAAAPQGCHAARRSLGGTAATAGAAPLSLSADQWRKAGSVSCEASMSGQSPVTQSLDPDHCSE
ncbi:hypothetical protein L3Q82_026402 [Scortum barcoo]|uniref:Uncharacterized protein n=1 Tax=Scortum barcoo TaxID=214431 RepID=A0ACB8WHZ0_9TELE|nr:hypothetical protein L3Q82_026402 [Scortum barcoo]